MFWMRLSTGNSSRRVRRYWALILQVKHLDCPCTNSPAARQDAIDPLPSPRASRSGRVSHRRDWSGPGCDLGLVVAGQPDSIARNTVPGGPRDCTSLAHPLNSVNANILRPAIAVLCVQRAHFGAESRLKMVTSRTTLRLRSGARACVPRSGTASDFRSAGQCGLVPTWHGPYQRTILG